MSAALLHNGKIYYGCQACKDNPIFRGVHDVPVEGPNAWGYNGDLDHPTLTPSVRTGYLRSDDDASMAGICHHFLRDGCIQYCSDSTHGRSDSAPILPVQIVGEYGVVELIPDIAR
jgi:hypothetical protein